MTPDLSGQPKLTPMMRQYFELKHQVGSAILLFRMGDFYEIFDTDAQEVAPKLDIVLTSREKGDEERVPFCGVPHHSAKSYWLKLLRLGYKVAIAEQTENPSEAKGLVRREIVRVLTPGCVDELEGLDHDAANYLVALYEVPSTQQWAVAAVDVSTGEFRLGSVALSEIAAMVTRFRPREILARKFCHEMLRVTLEAYLTKNQTLLEILPEGPLRSDTEQTQSLTDVFGTSTFEKLPCGEVRGGQALATAVISYLRGLKAGLKQFRTIRPLSDPKTMALGETAIRDLEIFETAMRRQTEGSLIRAIDRTLSPMGARLLRHSLAHPLIDSARITARHDAVALLLGLGESTLTQVREVLKGATDLQRLATRILGYSASPAELGLARRTLQKSFDLVNLFRTLQLPPKSFAERLVQSLARATQPLALLQRALVEAPGPLGSGAGIFAANYDEVLDERSELAKNGESRIAAYEAKLRERTGIGSLKIKSHKTFGVLIEVTKSNLSKVPSDFVRRQTMVNCERFITVDLRELGDALMQASDQAIAREGELYNALLAGLSNFRDDLAEVSEAIAQVDFLQALAWLALKENYTRAELSEDRTLDLQASRHPVIERFVGRHAFVPNDILITKQKRHLLITGPNMAGKSTVMRQTALLAILNQAGSFVPAAKARMPIFDRVFTRVGAADDLSRGHSTFMVEMSEAAEMLRQATDKSLVILDEVGRGTSTMDGLAIASAILSHLANKLGCYSLFATHYHELVPSAANLPSVRVVQTEVKRVDGQIQFTHRLIDGASGSSFGVEVARLAGIPDEVITAANEFIAVHEAELARTAPPMSPPHPILQASVASPQPELPRNLQFIVEQLERLKIHRTTPLQALNILNDLRSLLHQSPAPELFGDQPC